MLRRRRSEYSNWYYGLIVLALTLNAGCGGSANSTTSVVNSPLIDVPETDPEIVPPYTDPVKILKFMDDLQSHRREFKNRQEQVKYLTRIMRQMVRSGDQILSQDVEDTILKQAAAMKLSGMIGLVMNQVPGAAEESLATTNRMRKDNRPEVADVANEFWIPIRAAQIGKMSVSERQQLTMDAIEMVIAAQPSMKGVGEAAFVASQLENLNQTDEAVSVYEQLITILKVSGDSEAKPAIKSFQAKIAKLRLPGSQLELEGTLLGGGQLDWNSYR